MNINKFILFFALLFSIALVSAQLGIPHQFWGTVTYNDAPASNGISVVAKIDGVIVKEAVVLDGKYGYDPLFLITDPDGTKSGKTIFFYVNNIEAATHVFENGRATELNLAASGPIIVISPVTTGGGGGGGGGGRTPINTTNTTNTTIALNFEEQGTGISDSENTETGIEETEETQTGFFKSITGAVIGAVGTGGGIVFVFVIIIAIGAVIVFFIKRKETTPTFKPKKNKF